MDVLPDRLEMPILLKVGDNISTDEIMPAGARVLPYRSNIPKISEFVFENIDPTYHQRALERTPPGSHAIIAGENYGQGSSREHAAIAPRYLGLRMVIAKGFARIHRMNLVNFGILPVIFDDPSVYDRLELNDVIVMENVREQLAGSVNDRTLILSVPKKKLTFPVSHNLFPRMIEVILAGGLTNWTREKALRIRCNILAECHDRNVRSCLCADSRTFAHRLYLYPPTSIQAGSSSTCLM